MRGRLNISVSQYSDMRDFFYGDTTFHPVIKLPESAYRKAAGASIVKGFFVINIEKQCIRNLEYY